MREKQVKVNTAAGAWGSSGSWPPAIPLKELASLKSTLHGTEKRHRDLLQTFLGGLPEVANEVRRDQHGGQDCHQWMWACSKPAATV